MEKIVLVKITVSVHLNIDTDEFEPAPGEKSTIENCVESIVESIDLEGEAIYNLRKLGYRGALTKESYTFS